MKYSYGSQQVFRSVLLFFYHTLSQGIKSAAIRKLKHELGIEPEQISIQGFKYLGRIHYCAADTSNSASGAVDASIDGVWGEHEIDYILFIRAQVDLAPNPEEVR